MDVEKAALIYIEAKAGFKAGAEWQKERQDKQLEEAIKVIEFYAKETHWYLDGLDRTLEDDTNGFNGKRAREFLEKWNK